MSTNTAINASHGQYRNMIKLLEFVRVTNESTEKFLILEIQGCLVLGRKHEHGEDVSVSGEATVPVLVVLEAQDEVEDDDDGCYGCGDAYAGVEGGVVRVKLLLVVVRVILVVRTIYCGLVGELPVAQRIPHTFAIHINLHKLLAQCLSV